MTELNSTKQAELESEYENPEFLRTMWEGRQTDWLLQWLVRFSNNTNLSIGITLSVGGSLISGSLITHAAYFEQMSADFAGAFKKFEGLDIEELRSNIQKFNVEPEDAENQPPMQFLHLKDAKIYLANSTPVIPSGQLWRGKISAVDGFTLGTIVQA